MSLASKTNIDWRPTATLKALQQRAALYQSIRAFFQARGILEVETPILCPRTVTDVHIDSIPAAPTHAGTPQRFYLQTSPEYAMKRLLAQHREPFFQICKAFRDEEVGAQHNPEFSMLEWYRPGLTYHQLMDEVDALLQATLATPPAERQTYEHCFLTHAELNPHTITTEALKTWIHTHLQCDASTFDRDSCLQLILAERIEPHLGQAAPFFLYDFPASQAALSKLEPGPPAVGQRFELYYKGVELANGFQELTHADEQYKRFLKDQTIRQQKNKYVPQIDMHLIDALTTGLPECAGVALGLDRLLMVKHHYANIRDVISFPISFES